MSIVVTGAAGFIGFHTSKRLLDEGHKVVGIDCMNDYYDPKLKYDRLEILKGYEGFSFYKEDISDRDAMESVFKQYQDIEYIINLAAQAGVRHSLKDPYVYIQSNIMGQIVLLEEARRLPGFKHFVYASSSSVYGGNKKKPSSVEDNVDNPLAVYAASKKSAELMAHSYSYLYNMPTTGLRFFTVYGPWGRPDMAAYLFADAILEGKPMHVFNHGNMRRDFTYIDDIVSGITAVLTKSKSLSKSDEPPYMVYNLGNNKSEQLLRYIELIEENLGKTTEKIMEPMQPGDVEESFADIDISQKDLGFDPKTPIDVGLPKFIEWYKEYNNVKSEEAA
jgi:UDP-glucuronate 4-epimerase